VTAYATPDDLRILEDVARQSLAPSAGAPAERVLIRNALIRCARTVRRALRSEDDTGEIDLTR
jgi:hypothetical protein